MRTPLYSGHIEYPKHTFILEITTQFLCPQGVENRGVHCISRPWLCSEGAFSPSPSWLIFFPEKLNIHPLSYCTPPYTSCFCLLPLILAVPAWFLCCGWLCMCITRASEWQQPQWPWLPHFFARTKNVSQKFDTFIKEGWRCDLFQLLTLTILCLFMM